MIKTETPKRPTHRVYAVKKISEDKSHWTDIGAAWAHKDGKGFNVKLEFLPLLEGSEIVIREPLPTAAREALPIEGDR